MDKLRFPAPLPVGAEFRGSAVLDAVDEVNGGLQVKLSMSVEVKGVAKPALVAQCLYRYLA
jgi:acyl dehydratase